ncbi:MULTISPECIES: two-component system histidine kinase PnpS [Bacillus]|uniref:histidine kinase n=2 Tax=Bacillus TaxID=1386 RepID=A0A0M4G9E0_9BACI|nr:MULTISPECIES: ATP-binding protein [Bacillus]ALC81995.1 alkaline phosphatase [Bacillus gobiensis]MBP1083334.1 two-component system phosphate regulon sensor histidine kinase PhoR [Bacillus capparidis]MED1097766.1 ATP-binding protein [Bacillus capparidis]
MNNFRLRLFLALFTLVIAVFIALGLILDLLFNRFYEEKANDQIRHEAGLVESLLDTENLKSAENEDLLKKAVQHLQGQAMLLDESGNVIFESGHNGNHDKTIIKEMLEHERELPGFQVEDWDSRFLHYAVPFDAANGEQGYLLLSSPAYSMQEMERQMWWALAGGLGVALLILLFTGLKITSRYTTPIESATKVAMELARGNYDARTYEEHMNETSMLSQSINILARNLQDMTRAQQMQQDRLQTLIENMGSGLILIDGRGYINLVNRAFKEQFQIQPETFLYHLYYEAFQHEEVIHLVEEIFMTESKAKRLIHLPFRIERRYFEVEGAPITGNNEEWKGIVLVFHDITEMSKLEQMRKDFVANVSHELKTPITSIKGFSETLLDGAMKDEKTLSHFLSIILKESDRLESLIHDLLELSKLEKQDFHLVAETCDIKEIINDVANILSYRAEEKGIDIVLELPEEQVEVEGDPHRLKQVFINLMSNAVAYTSEKGSVNVTLKQLKDKVIAQVADTGIGIKKEHIPRIFERFYRVDRARSRNSGGTGLGLAIVKHIIEIHGGRIDVESELGKGTIFTIELNRNL